MRYYFIFEIKKLLARWQFIAILLLALSLTGFYLSNFFDIVVERYAVVYRLRPNTPFGLYFFSTMSGRINFILAISCALTSTLVWETETKDTLRQALKLTPGKVLLFLIAKVMLCLALLAIQLSLLSQIVSWNMKPFIAMLGSKFQFTWINLAHYFIIQYIWLVPILLLNICWYVWLGERAIIVFIFSFAGVYLCSFISFTPFNSYFMHGYGQVKIPLDDAFWLLFWTIGLLFFLRKQLPNYA